MTTFSDRDKVRLEIGDVDTSDALFTDAELDVFLARESIVSAAGTAVDVLRAAADACDALATRFSREFDFAEDGQSFQRSQRATLYSMRAKALRERGGGSSIPLVSSVAAATGDNLGFFGGTAA